MVSPSNLDPNQSYNENTNPNTRIVSNIKKKGNANMNNLFKE